MRFYMVDRPRLELGSLGLRGRTSPSKFTIYMAPRPGFEPGTTESKSVVLPLHHQGIYDLQSFDRRSFVLRNTKFLKNVCFISSRDVLYTIYDYLYTVWKTIFLTLCLSVLPDYGCIIHHPRIIVH